MISIAQAFAGSLQDAPPMSFFVATSVGELEMLVIGTPDNRSAVVLSGEDPFVAYGREFDDWAGLIIRDVAIELDQTCAFDSRTGQAPAGCIILAGDKPYIRLVGNHGTRYMAAIEGSAQPHQASIEVAFPRWQIILGQGDQKQVLKTIDVRSK